VELLKHWNRFSREVGESPFVKISDAQLDVIQSNLL